MSGSEVTLAPSLQGFVAKSRMFIPDGESRVWREGHQTAKMVFNLISASHRPVGRGVPSQIYKYVRYLCPIRGGYASSFL